MGLVHTASSELPLWRGAFLSIGLIHGHRIAPRIEHCGLEVYPPGDLSTARTYIQPAHGHTGQMWSAQRRFCRAASPRWGQSMPRTHRTCKSSLIQHLHKLHDEVGQRSGSQNDADVFQNHFCVSFTVAASTTQSAPPCSFPACGGFHAVHQP